MLRALPFMLAVPLLALALGPRVVAQEATPAAALPPPLDEVLAAWNAHDPQRLAALYAEDAVVEVRIASNQVFHGPEQVAAWAAGNFAAVPDLRFEIGRVLVAGDRVALEWVYTGTYTGQLPGLPPGAGQAIRVPGATVFELRDGKIVRETLYYDLYLFLIQTGAVPAPGAAATPGATSGA